MARAQTSNEAIQDFREYIGPCLIIGKNTFKCKLSKIYAR